MFQDPSMKMESIKHLRVVATSGKLKKGHKNAINIFLGVPLLVQFENTFLLYKQNIKRNKKAFILVFL